MYRNSGKRCPKCLDNSWLTVFTGDATYRSYAVRCECWSVTTVKTVQQQAELIGVPKALRDCTFDNFMSVNGSIDTAKKACQSMVSLWPRNRQGMILIGGKGVGKCLGPGTPVMLADGSVAPVESVRVGDELMGPDSQPRRVLSTSAGTGPLYLVEPKKGSPWVCNAWHVMTLVDQKGQWFDVPLDEFLALPHNSVTRNQSRLIRTAIDFPTRPTPTDPWLAGLWIGDGDKHHWRITTGSKELADLLVGDGTATSATPNGKGGRCWNVFIRRPKFPDRLSFLVDGQRRIPELYLKNDRPHRLAMLAGLIDSDGHASNGCYEVITRFVGLRDDILYLCRSLGLAAYASKKDVRLLGWDQPRTYWRIIISGDMSDIPIRRQARILPPRKTKKDPLRTGWTATPIGVGPYFGFELDGDGRFLLGDFTVTHNSHLGVATLVALAQAGAECLFVNLTMLLQDLKQSFEETKDQSMTEAILMRKVQRVEVLMLDEFGAEYLTDWVKDVIYRVIVYRYNEEKTTILTTGYKAPVSSDFAPNQDNTIEGRVGGSIDYKINLMCERVLMDGQPYQGGVAGQRHAGHLAALDNNQLRVEAKKGWEKMPRGEQRQYLNKVKRTLKKGEALSPDQYWEQAFELYFAQIHSEIRQFKLPLEPA